MRISSCTLVFLVTLLSCSMAGEWDVYEKFYTRMMNTDGDTYSFIVNAIFNGAKNWLSTDYLLPNHQEFNKCFMDLGKFREAYEKKELWALKMLDASAKFPSGFLKGNIVDLGNFKECINIDNKNVDIVGKNCFVYFETLAQNKPWVSNFLTVESSVCVPASCEATHLQTILYRSLSSRGFLPYVGYCQTKDSLKPQYATLDIIILTSFGILGAILFIGTSYDILLHILPQDTSEHVPLIENGKDIEERSKLHRSILSFSLLANTADLFKTDTAAKSIKCLYGLRFLSACFIISIHRMILDPQPLSNSFSIELEIRKWYRALQMNAYLFVDLFFVMSGLLISYKYSSSMRGKLKLFYYFIHRYIRLTPPLLVCVMLELISPIFCDGPYCEPFIQKAKKRCLDNAIYTLTYINNFINPSHKCLLHSWYLSADMQMYFLAPILILFLKKWRRSIPFILLSCLAASMLSIFLISYINELDAGYIGENAFYELDSKLVYEPFYTRAGPWIIGFSLGIILQSFNKEPYRLKKKTVTVGWIVAIICLLVAVFGVYPFVQRGYVHDHISDSLYKAFHRNLFGLGCAWIIYVCYTGQSELLNQILSSPSLQPLGKVSYCLYVIHPFVQMLQYRSVSSSRKYSDLLQGSLVIGDICYSVVFAIFLHLAVEAPTLKLENIFLSSLRGDNSKTKEEERLEMFKSNIDEKGQV